MKIKFANIADSAPDFRVRETIERGFVLELRKWQSICLDSKERGLFPSPMTGRPYHADSIRADYLVPTGLQLGLGRIEFHTFRHYAESRNMPHLVD